VRPERIAFSPPFFDQHLGLLQCIENLTIEQLVSELAIETLDVSVFPICPPYFVFRVIPGGQIKEFFFWQSEKYIPKG
jgi:hypothetical protein